MASASRLLRLETGWQACTFVNNNKRRPTPPLQGATCIPPDLNNYRQTHTLGATAVAREAGFPAYFYYKGLLPLWGDIGPTEGID